MEPFSRDKIHRHGGSECIRDFSNRYQRNGLGYLVLGQCRDQQNRNGEAIEHQIGHRSNGLVLDKWNSIISDVQQRQCYVFLYLGQTSKVRSRMPHPKRMLTQSLKERFSGDNIHR